MKTQLRDQARAAAADWEQLVHELNQRYRREFDRAERLQAELDDLHRSRWWPLLCRLRRWRAWWRGGGNSTGAAPILPDMVLERFIPTGEPGGRVSVIVPFRDQLGLLRNLLHGLRRTADVDLEIILVDNGSQDPRMQRFLARWEPSHGTVVSCPGPFNFAALANAGARHATCPWLLFLNNDVEVIHAGWLGHLLAVAGTPGVGVVGATLVYPDRSIQHAGIYPSTAATGSYAGVVWEHRHRFRPPSEWMRDPELTDGARTVPAVTAACLLCSQEWFAKLGGFDERFPTTHNDVDLCLRTWAAGRRVAISGQARLIHYESLSRGYCKDA